MIVFRKVLFRSPPLPPPLQRRTTCSPLASPHVLRAITLTHESREVPRDFRPARASADRIILSPARVPTCLREDGELSVEDGLAVRRGVRGQRRQDVLPGLLVLQRLPGRHGAAAADELPALDRVVRGVGLRHRLAVRRGACIFGRCTRA